MLEYYRSARFKALAFASGLITVGVLGFGAWWLPAAYEGDLGKPFHHRTSAWAGSASCRACHQDHYASWHRTFHRTMTQDANPASVVGAFDGRTVTFQGVAARPVRQGDAFFIEYLDPAGNVFRKLRVRRTVGSHRYQQYLVDSPLDNSGNLYRIPLLWHIGEQRWIHLNGAFLEPDGQPYDEHVAIWNQNCIFCHNTGPRPGSRNFDELVERSRRGEPVDPAFDGRYESSVAELGIACEMCHGPAAEHVHRNRDPIRRYLLHFTNRSDPTIVHPGKLPKARSVDVCGQCHGQRLPNPPERIRNFLIDGPIYRSGERLQDSVRPIFQDTPPPPGADPELFRLRFWSDGTPRLSAYEYQGLLLSPCFQEGGLTCVSCHSAHGGDIRGMIRPVMRTNQACAGCHRKLVENVSNHTRHAVDSPGSNCYECHMPRIVYGVLEVHRSHRIEIPNPAHDAEAGRPDACTNCHLNRSASWAARRLQEWWPNRYRLPRFRGDGAPIDMPDLTAALLAGDPIQRVVAARLAGRTDAPITAATRAVLIPVLLEGLKDEYPTVRWFTQQSLRSLQKRWPIPGFGKALQDFDYLAEASVRDPIVRTLEKRWREVAKKGLPAPPAGTLLNSAYELQIPDVERIKALRSTKRISIGE